MTKRVFVSCVSSVATVFAMAAGVGNAANGNASCNGLAVSSLAGAPGIVAQLTRQFHDDTKAAGLPPGSFDAEFAKVHAGSVEACLGGG